MGNPKKQLDIVSCTPRPFTWKDETCLEIGHVLAIWALCTLAHRMIWIRGTEADVATYRQLFRQIKSQSGEQNLSGRWAGPPESLGWNAFSLRKGQNQVKKPYLLVISSLATRSHTHYVCEYIYIYVYLLYIYIYKYYMYINIYIW